jgi:hypothetical protein
VKTASIIVKNSAGKSVFESEVKFVDFTAELTLDLDPGEYCVEIRAIGNDKRMVHPKASSETRLSVIPPQSEYTTNALKQCIVVKLVADGSFNYLLGLNRAKDTPTTFIVPDDNPVERVAVFCQQTEDKDTTHQSIFYAINRLGEVWEMTCT